MKMARRNINDDDIYKWYDNDVFIEMMKKVMMMPDDDVDAIYAMKWNEACLTAPHSFCSAIKWWNDDDENAWKTNDKHK